MAGATTTSVKMALMRSAAAASRGWERPTMPPKAASGSPERART
jgi:hypothetical protein